MPSCRSCHRARIGGPRQEQQQLVKYRKGDTPHIIVNAPSHVATFDQRLLHQHLPKLFHHARNEGNRVVDPYQIFAQNFTHVSDPGTYTTALEWVLNRVQNYGHHPYFPGQTINIRPQDNVFLRILQDLNDAFAFGNHQLIEILLQRSVALLTAISNILRGDQGFDLSDKLLEEYLRTAEAFLPWFSTYDLWCAFDVMKAAFQISDQDPGAVRLLSQTLGPQQRIQLRQLAEGQAWQGDLLAAKFAAFIV
ncbi:hypothetical protein BJ875DRAFT_224384 [Amylocarpus encephaloides]|uniref:Uncharacterized protein n=1 Tax=Amylocarpus encephaloides TaxID=45428 RepID=A0A9P7Y8E9_9HELO|nr:hypothetical protein BJ875DRAFT_224384 [Amylocarpus encephaloides]